MSEPFSGSEVASKPSTLTFDARDVSPDITDEYGVKLSLPGSELYTCLEEKSWKVEVEVEGLGLTVSRTPSTAANPVTTGSAGPCKGVSRALRGHGDICELHEEGTSKGSAKFAAGEVLEMDTCPRSAV